MCIDPEKDSFLSADKSTICPGSREDKERYFIFAFSGKESKAESFNGTVMLESSALSWILIIVL
ncbi:Uncharacterised protein [Chlamydia abortus]|nr:Uncharacterised protein [Chlamydia abortus]